MSENLSLLALTREFNTDLQSLIDFLQRRGYGPRKLKPDSVVNYVAYQAAKAYFMPIKPKPAEPEKEPIKWSMNPDTVQTYIQVSPKESSKYPDIFSVDEVVKRYSIPESFFKDHQPERKDQDTAVRRIEEARSKGANSLDLRDLQLEKLPSEITSLKDQLVSLQLGKLTSQGLNLLGLKHLRLDPKDPIGSSADLTALKELTHLKKLEIHRLGRTQLSQLQSLTGLEELGLEDPTGIDLSLLSVFKQLKKLTITSGFSGNYQIEDLRPLRELSQLQSLELIGTAVTDITPLASLSNLRLLRLRNNSISDIGPLSRLRQLEGLDLAHNGIRDLSPLEDFIRRNADRPSFIYLGISPAGTDLTHFLDVMDNPLENPPMHHLVKGPKEILAFWEQKDIHKRLNDWRSSKEAKLIIVGNSNSGKSTLAYYLKNNDKLPPKALDSTRGLDFGKWLPKWKIGDKELTIHIIDFGGQEYYHDTHHLLFDHRAVYLLLWDLSTDGNQRMLTRNKETRHFRVGYWLNAIKIYTQGRSPVNNINPTPVLLVQTHLDPAVGRKLLNLADLQTTYPQLYDAVTINMDVEKQETSGMNILKCQLENMYRQMANSFTIEYAEPWLLVRRHIQKNEKEFRIMTLAEFETYFYIHSETTNKETNIQLTCTALDYWGVIFYRNDLKGLEDIVILNPRHFTTSLNTLLGEQLRAGNGVINPTDLDATLGDKGKVDAFIKVLLVFKILFRLPARTKRAIEEGHPPQEAYISPMYLREKPADLELSLYGYTAFYRIRYDAYFHKGILLDCFHLLGEDIYDSASYWQWGIVLKRGNSIICVEFDQNNLDHVLIRMAPGTKAPGKDELLRHILASFETINKDYDYHLEVSLDGMDFLDAARITWHLQQGLSKLELMGKRYHLLDYLSLIPNDKIHLPIKKVFVSYSSKDGDQMQVLDAHLAMLKKAGQLDYWFDQQLTDDRQWDDQIEKRMQEANIILVLLSPNSLRSNYIVDREIKNACDYLQTGEKRVIWALVRHCSYASIPHIARHPVYPLKSVDPVTGIARQVAIAHADNPDEEWVKILEMILNEE